MVSQFQLVVAFGSYESSYCKNITLWCIQHVRYYYSTSLPVTVTSLILQMKTMMSHNYSVSKVVKSSTLLQHKYLCGFCNLSPDHQLLKKQDQK